MQTKTRKFLVLTDERLFESRLESLGWDARSCAVFIYTELALQHLRAQSREVREQLEAHDTFWNGIVAALRGAGIAALDRLYDEARNAGSTAHVVRFAERHKTLFSAPRLEARQLAIGVPDSIARQRAAQVAELRPGAFEPLFRELDEMRRLHTTVLQPLREHVIADLGGAPARGTDLFGGAHSSDLQRLAVFPLRLHRALSELYYEGREPQLDDAPMDIEDLLTQERSNRPDVWEHHRAALAVVEFFGSVAALRELARPKLPAAHS